MKIKRMTASFGALEGRSLTLSDGLNILYAPNESGKSTWCAFLRTMLYGLDTAQRAKAGQKPDKIKYKPWSGAPMSGTMDLVTAEDGAVTLTRWTERENQPMQMFSATVTGTARPVPGLTADTAGERLAGVSREVFERSAFIRQAGLELSNDPELDRRVAALLSSGEEDVSYLETDKLLRAWLRHRRSGRRGAIPELEQEMAATREKLRKLEAEAGHAAALEEELTTLERERDEAVAQMQQARAAQRRQALAELSASRARTEEAEGRTREARARLQTAREAMAKTAFGEAGAEAAGERIAETRRRVSELDRLTAKKPSAAPAVIALLAALAALAAAFLTEARMLFAGTGCAALLLTVVLFFVLSSRRRQRLLRLAERRRLLSELGAQAPEELEAIHRAYLTLCGEKASAALACDSAEETLTAAREARKQAEARLLGELDFTQGDSPAARAGRRVEELNARAAALREDRAAAEGEARALGDPMVLGSALTEQRRRYEELCAQEEALKLAIDAMAGADAELQQRFSPKLAAEAAALFARLTDGRYDEITLARDLTARTRRAGDAVGWEADYLSAGARDQLYLALRLAVCRIALPGEDPCPIVLDDALVNFDRARLETALKLLRELAETRQILLFTCHEREFDYFAEDPSVARLRL